MSPPDALVQKANNRQVPARRLFLDQSSCITQAEPQEHRCLHTRVESRLHPFVNLGRLEARGDDHGYIQIRGALRRIYERRIRYFVRTRSNCSVQRNLSMHKLF